MGLLTFLRHSQFEIYRIYSRSCTIRDRGRVRRRVLSSCIIIKDRPTAYRVHHDTDRIARLHGVPHVGEPYEAMEE